MIVTKFVGKWLYWISKTKLPIATALTMLIAVTAYIARSGLSHNLKAIYHWLSNTSIQKHDDGYTNKYLKKDIIDVQVGKTHV